MKTHHLVLPVLALSHGIDDTPTLLSLKMKVHQRLEAGLDHLLDVAGNRNVTQLSSLLQDLVQDTIESSGYDLDGEVQAALQMIKDALLGDIRGALKDAHCHDQQELHEQITCFEKCEEQKADGASSCGESCDGKAHKVCRDLLLKSYKKHIIECRALDDWVRDFTKQSCPKFEKKCCLLSHTTWNCGLCETKIAGVEVDGSTGQWINKQISIFEHAHEEWTKLHKTCTEAYHSYVEKDAECDCAQAECETRNCEWESCHYLNCEDSYNKCWGRCEAEYTRTNEAKECLEKDRKIDWSATEKIECYVDVLLAKPSNKTLLEECGTEDCINKFREQQYKKCNERCVEVDFDSGKQTFHDRREDDIDVTNEGSASVFTKHRGAGEDRCTSHLDLDYQLPPCCNPCEARPSPPCEGRGDYKDESSYMWIHYDQFGHFSEDDVEGVSAAICHTGEHSKVYAYNLCDCKECPAKQLVDPATCTQAKACRAGAYDYTQHEITNACQATPAPPPMDLPDSNCPMPAESKACHFWGDPHFSHLFFSNAKVADEKKGGRHHGHHVLEFRPFGVFNLAENEDQTFQAQAFFCPWKNTGAPGVGAGLAMRFGDDIIQVVRGPTTQMHGGGMNKDTTQFFVNGELKAWDELGNASASLIRGKQVPGTGGITSAFMYMQQEKTTNQNPYLPVCVGNAQDTLVEVGVQSMYYQDVTIRTNRPGNRGIASGICSSEPGSNIDRTDAKTHEKYRVKGSQVLFSTKQMKHLCDVCNLDAHEDRSGWTCGAPGMNASPEQVCKSTGADLEVAKKKCGEVFDFDDDWFGVCVMETCASGEKAVAISRIEEHLQHLMVEEE